MHKGRLEAFSDGVVAILITIMVLELKVPHEPTLAAMRPLVPTLLFYAMSFVFLGIYWSNHHHMFQAVRHVNGAVLWANLHLMFWLSLIPFATSWMGENATAPIPVALYGGLLCLCGLAYYIMARLLVRIHGAESAIARAIGNDFKGKLSLVIYLASIPLAFVATWISCGCFGRGRDHVAGPRPPHRTHAARVPWRGERRLSRAPVPRGSVAPNSPSRAPTALRARA